MIAAMAMAHVSSVVRAAIREVSVNRIQGEVMTPVFVEEALLQEDMIVPAAQALHVEVPLAALHEAVHTVADQVEAPPVAAHIAAAAVHAAAVHAAVAVVHGVAAHEAVAAAHEAAVADKREFRYPHFRKAMRILESPDKRFI